MAKPKKSHITPSERRHAAFMVNTLAPDLHESGRRDTAADVRRCGFLAIQNKKAPKFTRWLKSTLIPDLRASGMKSTAADLAKCVRIVEKKRRK